jgi:hypothetical protein
MTPTEPEFVQLVSAEPAPGPAARVSRTAGQGGAALTLINLWQAFGWFGADGWTTEQAQLRWPALTAAIWLVITAVQNVAGWWRAERRRGRLV